ncbi:T9SS type A sorting domain-containing protein [Sphingobacterium sp. HJSM2_6]|uniref:T9SS type A sorting domain-containing protein n=1 Tax=Sphingobacterium sp. HJSM2_6 TaxID=3366264 RepID=UPI003BC112F3
MKLNIHHTILSCLFFIATVGYVQASNIIHFSDTTKNPNDKLIIASAKTKNATKMQLLAEEGDKLITNVKVIYNPISSEISVGFKLAKANAVIIKVMDALGNEVMNLHNANLDAGMQNLSFPTNQKLAEGFYFVRVTSGSETVVKRISVR